MKKLQHRLWICDHTSECLGGWKYCKHSKYHKKMGEECLAYNCEMVVPNQLVEVKCKEVILPLKKQKSIFKRRSSSTRPYQVTRDHKHN